MMVTSGKWEAVDFTMDEGESQISSPTDTVGPWTPQI